MHWHHHRRWIFILFLAGLLLFVCGLVWLITDPGHVPCIVAATVQIIVGIVLMAWPLFRQAASHPPYPPYSSYPLPSSSTDPNSSNDPSMPATYPVSAFHFQVTWGGVRLGFSEISGMSLELDVIRYREGDDKDATPSVMPGMKRTGEVTLKRGILHGDNDMYVWFDSVLPPTVERRDITISVLNEQHEPVVVYKLQQAWIRHLDYGPLNAATNQVLIESMTVVHEGLKVEMQ